MSLSTHVLDTARGRPAAGIEVRCERRTDQGWEEVTADRTDADGRIGDLVGPGDLRAGVHRLTFDTGAYARDGGGTTFWPEVSIAFEVTAPAEHHHVPLLLSPYGYSTYRGS